MYVDTTQPRRKGHGGLVETLEGVRQGLLPARQPVRGGIQSLQVSSWDCRSEEVSKAAAQLGARVAKLPGPLCLLVGAGLVDGLVSQPRLCSVGVTPCSQSPVHPSIFLTFLFRNISINALAFRCFSCWDQDAPSRTKRKSWKERRSLNCEYGLIGLSFWL